MASTRIESKDEQYVDEKETTEQPSPEKRASGDESPDPLVDSDDIPWKYYLSKNFIGTYISVNLIACSLFISYTMPVSLLAVIDADIGPSSSITLVTLMHTLLKGVILLVIGRITDIFGRRWVLILSQVLITVGSIPCALAQNVETLIGGTVIIGIPGGFQLLYPLLCQEIVPNKHRGLSQAILTIIIFPFMGFGGVIARALVENTELGWRWTYWINVIICGISVVLLYFCYHPPTFKQIVEGKTKRQQLAELDYIGLTLYVGGTICLLLGFVWSTNAAVGGWQSPRVIALIVVGGCGLIAFMIYEFKGNPKTPLIPLKLFKIKGFLAVVCVGVVGQMGFYSFNLFVPQIAQNLFTTKNIEIGLISSIANSGLALGEIIAGFIWKYAKHNRLQIIMSSVSLALFTGLMALVNQYRMAAIIAIVSLAGLCIGWMQLLCLLNTGLITPPDQIGAGQGFFGSCRNIAGTIAVSIFVSINGNRIAQTIPNNIPPAVTDAGLPESSLPDLFAAMANRTAGALMDVPGMNEEIMDAYDTARKDSYSQAYQTVYLASIAFSAVCIVASWFAADCDNLMTGHLNKRVDGQLTAEREDVVDETKKVEKSSA